MLEQSCPRAWEACRLALTLLLASTVERAPCVNRKDFDAQLLRNARFLLRRAQDREPDESDWLTAREEMRQRLARHIDSATGFRLDVPDNRADFPASDAA